MNFKPCSSTLAVSVGEDGSGVGCSSTSFLLFLNQAAVMEGLHLMLGSSRQHWSGDLGIDSSGWWLGVTDLQGLLLCSHLQHCNGLLFLCSVPKAASLFSLKCPPFGFSNSLFLYAIYLTLFISVTSKQVACLLMVFLFCFLVLSFCVPPKPTL